VQCYNYSKKRLWSRSWLIRGLGCFILGEKYLRAHHEGHIKAHFRVDPKVRI